MDDGEVEGSLSCHTHGFQFNCGRLFHFQSLSRAAKPEPVKHSRERRKREMQLLWLQLTLKMAARL